MSSATRLFLITITLSFVVGIVTSLLWPEPAAMEGFAYERHLYDPAAVCRYHRSGWSVLADCATWHGARRCRADLPRAAEVLRWSPERRHRPA